MSSTSARRRGWIVVVASAALLLSMGGAIFAAPITLPVLYLATRRSPTRALRIAATIVGGLTGAEAAWALTYITIGEARPWVWLLPLVAGGVVAAAYTALRSSTTLVHRSGSLR